MIGNDPTVTSNSEIDVVRLPPCFANLLPHTYKINHCLAFYKRADEPYIQAPNPYDEEQVWLKNQNNFLKPIW